GAGDVLPGPDLCANVAAGVARALRILRSSLLVGKELPGGVLCGPFERSIELVEPNAFETGMTPGSLWNSRGCRRRPRRRPRRRRLTSNGQTQKHDQGDHHRRNSQRLEKPSPHLFLL